MREWLGKRLTGQFFFLLCCIFFLPLYAGAAELVFVPLSGSFAAGSEFEVKINVDPKTESVNAADGTVTFNKDLLSVVSINKDGSVFSLWTADPTFSNAAGTISFSGGTPKAFSSSGTVLSVKFKVKAAGSVALSFSSGSILAADGKGTDVYAKGADATFTLTEAANEPELEPEADDSGAAAKPILPVITSSTHAKPDVWYATSTVEFSWKPTVDVTTVRTILTDTKGTAPTVTQKTDVTSQRVVGVKDGEWYAYVQYKNEFGWGDVAERAFLVDSTPPKEFTVTLRAEGDHSDAPKFSLQAEDELSGIDRYEIRFGESTVATFRAQDLVSGMYPVPPQEGGAQRVTVRAYDKAGNVREATDEFTLPKVAKALKKGEEVEKPPVWTSERIALILFALIIGALAAWNMFTKKAAAQEKMHILQELARARDKNDKIFSAMREEFEDMVNELDERPQLTPAERDFLEKMKEALEISEELVDSGMEELKKTIRG